MPTRTMFTRRRSESFQSNDGSVTPADELSSWLPDDVCTTCGSAVHAGQLYCSQECRDEDAHANSSTTATTKMTSSSKVASTSTSAPRLSRAHKGLNPSSTVSPRSQALELTPSAEGKSFRYVCPPSPNLLGKYGAAHLTSPALAALDRRPTAATANATSDREWTSSSELSSSKRRSSSRSTYSSASDAHSTDPSTPSPLLARTSPNDDLDDLESSEFNLPPSVFSSAVVMLNVNSRDGKAKSRTSPVDKKVPLPSSKAQQQPPKREAMSYARRPSSTNLPAPVMFTSPVLTTTTMRASTSAPRRTSHGAGANGSFDHSAYSSSWQLRNSRKAAALSPSQLSSTLSQKRASAAAVPVRSSRTAIAQLVRKSSNSPVQPTSASSSAGRTLRAFSPPSTAAATSLSPLEFVGMAVCGRFGCQGFSGSAEATKEQHEDGRSPMSAFGHKHTHSAIANLNLLGQKQEQQRRTSAAGTADVTPAATNAAAATAAAKLKMTPMLGARAVLPQATPTDADVSTSIELDRTVRSPPRGRSKARGRSSTSRRSPSPPRGVARRGRSEDALYMKSLSSISPRSNPIQISHATAAAAAHLNDQSDADDEGGEDDAPVVHEQRRGRSPTERRGRAQQRRVGVTTPTLAKDDIVRANARVKSMPPPMDSLGSEVSSVVSANNSSGYDDVDLDGV